MQQCKEIQLEDSIKDKIMCLYPKLIQNRKYTSNKKNGGVVPAVSDERVKLIPVGCGDCIECRKQKARGWQVRLLEDIKTNTNGKFVTLTFSNESILEIHKAIEKECKKNKIAMPEGYTLDNAIATKAVRLFNENWRAKHKKALRHWLVTELGHNGTENIHLHGIVWTDKPEEEITARWGYGYTWIGDYVNGRTVNYIIKYVTKRDDDHQHYKSIILTSPGIGGNYMRRSDWQMNKYKPTGTVETYRTSTGHKVAMPSYWRNKIYSDEEREKLWIEKLDKAVRYVCGEKIDVSTTEEQYYKILDYHRKRNIRLGYTDGERDWEREVYERERRIILQKQRIDAATKKTKSVEGTAASTGNPNTQQAGQRTP